MRRGEVWWAHLPHPVGRRPVVFLSRGSAYRARSAVTVAPVTRAIRKIWDQNEYPSEVIEILRQYVDGQISVKDGEKVLTDRRREERKTRMQTPQEFAEEFLQRDRSWWEMCFEYLGLVFFVSGVGLAIWHFYDQPGQLAVPFLLAGIACFLVLLFGYANGIVADLEYLQAIVKEGEKRGE